MKTLQVEQCPPVISVDLMKSWDRSDHKPDDWTRETAARALARYERFLRLIAANPRVAYAPTRDIDEMWHLHMLSPRAYADDCDRLFGEVLDHDGGFGKEESEVAELKAVFERTAAMWEFAYGEAYMSADSSATKCWHDCASRCWHACSSNSERLDEVGGNLAVGHAAGGDRVIRSECAR